MPIEKNYLHLIDDFFVKNGGNSALRCGLLAEALGLMMSEVKNTKEYNEINTLVMKALSIGIQGVGTKRQN